MSNYIYLIVGESGCGKTTIINALEQHHNLKSIPSYTTRPERYPNEYGHMFITEEEFAKLKNLCAFTNFNGFRYAATSEQVDNHDLYVIDLDGIEFFKTNYVGTKEAKIIYLRTPVETRLIRMLHRGDSMDSALDRIRNDKISFTGASKVADLVIDNIDKDESIRIILKYINETKSNKECIQLEENN